MTIFETIGLFWVILTSSAATAFFFYFAWIGIRRTARQAVRGGVEENLDLRRQTESRFGRTAQ